MTATLFSLLALFLSGFVMMLGSGLINILLPSRLSIENVSADNIGLIMSMFSVGLLIGGIYTRRLIESVGHIRVYAASAAMAAISILSCYLWFNEWLWAVMRILMGFCVASTAIVSDGWLSERATSDTRARILATNQIVILSAMFLGSFLINLGDISSATLYIMAGVLLCSGVVPIAMTSASAPELDDAPPMSLLKLIKTSQVGVMSVLMCGFMLGSLLSMTAVYGQAKGISGVHLSLLVGSAVIGGVILQFPIGYLADRYDRRRVILSIVAFSILCTLAVPFAIDFDFFYVALILVSLSSGIISSLYPLGIAEAFDRLQQNEMGGAIGAMMMTYASGGIIGPYTVGLVMEYIGVNAFFTFMAIVQLVFVLFVIYRSTVRKSIPIDQQEAFVAQGATGWVSTELDPRTEYVESPTLSAAAQAAVDMAHSNPELALDMVSLIAKASPDQAVEAAGAVASVEGVDVTELYKRLNPEVPDQQHQEFVQTIITATPEPTTEFVSAVFDEAESEDIAELATAMTEAAPEQSMEIIEAATEAVLDDNPEIVVDIAEAYHNNVANNWEEMRYADRLADESEQNINDMVSMIAEKAPEQIDDVNAFIAESDTDFSDQSAGSEEEQDQPSDKKAD